MYYRMLYLFHLLYFTLYACTTFLPKYFGELGMTDGQIGMLMSLPAIAGVACQPFFGMLTDRVRLKKYVVIGLLAGLSLVSFLLEGVTSFALLMAGMAIFSILQLPIAPAYSAISMEYTSALGRSYGPIRLMGTFGYQLGALAVGLVLVGSLQGLFRFIGILMLLTCASACFLPPVAGHQHGRQKVKMGALMQDKHLVALFGMVLLGSITAQFYQSFFSKHLGDLGIDNTTTSIILIVSVAMEIPFLLLGDRLLKKTSIWNWLLLCYAINAVRWVGLAVSKSVWLLLLFQIPSVSVMACFEFFPVIYINRRVPDALQGSAQTILMIVSFGLSKVIGSLVGGFVSDMVGIPAVFAFNGVMLAVLCIAFIRPVRRLIAQEGMENTLEKVSP